MLVFLCVLPLTHIVTTAQSRMAMSQVSLPKHPPLVPYWVPFLGNLFAFLKNPAQLSSSVLREFPVSTPVRLKLGPIKMYIVSGSDNIVTLFKSSRSMSTKPGMIIALRNIFGTSPKTISFYASDDTGMSTKPYPGSTCRVEHRIIYYQQNAAHQHLTGPGLLSMAERYMKVLAEQLSDLKLGEDWTDFADLYEFLQIQVAKASIEAMCGKHILRLNPTFIEDFWAFDRSVGTLLKGLPRWLCPRQYSARDKILSGIKKWHAFAHMHSDCNRTASNDPDWEPFFGHKLVRERQKYSMKMDAMDADARASEDLGLIFAGNTNAVPAAFWFVFEAFKDHRLLSHLRQELETSQKSYEKQKIPDINTICGGQLLQSVYAETLRLRVAILITRAPEHDDFQLGEFLFPKDKLIAVSSRTAAMDNTLWNTGSTEDPHPLDEFWAERFLIHPPLRRAKDQPKVSATDDQVNGIPRFSMNGLSGAWIPYGGGQRMCPGRHFAKQEIIGTFALLSTLFDIEILGPSESGLEADMRYFPLGGLPPKEKVPFRIRTRK